MNTERTTVEKLVAPEGKVYTQIAELKEGERIYATTVYLGNIDTETNWKLVPITDIPE